MGDIEFSTCGKPNIIAFMVTTITTFDLPIFAEPLGFEYLTVFVNFDVTTTDLSSYLGSDRGVMEPPFLAC